MKPGLLRSFVYSRFIETGRAPTLSEMTRHFHSAEKQLRGSLRWLHDAHHIVLQDDDEIIAAHPFSNVPMPFDVVYDDVHAWGFCIWDSLGIGAMTGRNTSIATRCAQCLAAMRLEIRDGVLTAPTNAVAQYVVPAQRMWDDVCFTCSTQLPFCDAGHAEAWRVRYGQPLGSVLSLTTSWDLAQAWYGEDRRRVDWRRRTVAEANAIFERLKLATPFWHLTERT